MLIVRDAELIETEIDGDLVALDVARGTCLGFNATASRVWALLEQPTRLSALVDRLGEEFDVAPEACARDVRALIDDLTAQKLVRVSPV